MFNLVLNSSTEALFITSAVSLFQKPYLDEGKGSFWTVPIKPPTRD